MFCRSFVVFMTMFLAAFKAEAQVYGPSVQEFSFKVQSQFISNSAKSAWVEEANTQLSHVFGVFHSPTMVRSFALNPYSLGGIGALQYPVSFELVSRTKQKDGTWNVVYQASGKMLVHKRVAEKIALGARLEVPLPRDPENYYDRQCTDDHYDTLGDFWYFFDPFRKGCEYLGRPPFADTVQFELRPVTQRKLDMQMRLDLLRANNDNGDLFRIDVIHGFADSAAADDMGRENFERLHQYLEDNGFSRKDIQRFQNRPIVRYTKMHRLASGREIEVQINSLLVETGIDKSTVTFAKFFRDSVADADVIFYAGHSGLGANLDIGLLESKAGGFTFNPRKRQIFFFESCSSYSYYLDSFREQKSRARLDIVTNGLSSYFETGHVMLTTFLESLLTEQEDLSWPEALKELESNLGGHSYLTNVGGI